MRALVVYVGDNPNEQAFPVPRLPKCSFLIPVRGPKERFVSAWSHDDVDYEDRGSESPRQRTDHYAKDFMGKDPKGNDILLQGVASQMLFSPASGTDQHARGFFIAEGDKPTEDELVAAEKARDVFRRRLIDDARFRFQKDRHSRNIVDEAFWAAERMGLEEDWMPIAANPCANCGRAVKSTAATCVHCGLILDEKRYAEFKFATVPAAPPPSTGLRAAGAAR